MKWNYETEAQHVSYVGSNMDAGCASITHLEKMWKKTDYVYCVYTLLNQKDG